MTTDIVKYTSSDKGAATAGGLIIRRSLEKLLVDIDVKRGYDRKTNQDNGQNESWERLVGATIALLNKANHMIDRAEEIIASQESRILSLEELATSDELTGLKNRRGFYEDFMTELDRCDRALSKGGLLVLIDLDNFKAINDIHGHLAGDACLRLVAMTLQNEVRLMDTAGRLGGDEFVLLLSNTTKEEAAARAQMLAWRLNNLSLAWHGEEIPVQASIGLESFGKGDESSRIFNAADQKLYENKRARAQEGFRHNRKEQQSLQNKDKAMTS